MLIQQMAYEWGPDGSYVTGENVNVDCGLRHIAMEHMMPAGGTYKPD
jgi:hypothetical protein